MHAPAYDAAGASGHLTASALVMHAKPAGLMAWTLDFLDRCTYRAMTSPEDIEALSEMRWKNYMEGQTLKNERMTVDEFEDGKDSLPTARTVGLYVDGRLASSMRIHAVNAEHGNTCVIDVHRERIETEIAKGMRFVYANRWISDPEFSNTMPLIVATTRITCLAAEYHRADRLISLSRENHVKTYVRIHNADVWSEEPKPIDNLNYLYHLISSSYDNFRGRMWTDRQAYISSARERDGMFSPSADNALFVKPSARAVLCGEEDAGFWKEAA
jgi:hypothetical protein